jgi:hypothetical protein
MAMDVKKSWLETPKNSWKKMQDAWQQLSFAGLGAIGLTTLCVVFHPAIIPILTTLAIVVAGTLLAAASRFIAGWFKKADAKPVAVTHTAASTNTPEKSSTAAVNAQLNAHAVPAVAPAPVVPAVAPVVAKKTPDVAANDNAPANHAARSPSR